MYTLYIYILYNYVHTQNATGLSYDTKCTNTTSGNTILMV